MERERPRPTLGQNSKYRMTTILCIVGRSQVTLAAVGGVSIFLAFYHRKLSSGGGLLSISEAGEAGSAPVPVGCVDDTQPHLPLPRLPPGCLPLKLRTLTLSPRVKRSFTLVLTTLTVSTSTQNMTALGSVAAGSSAGGTKTVRLVNGSSPGPELRVNHGDWLEVTVLSDMPDDGTTVHWHGFQQLGTPWADGMQGISQCLIPASNGGMSGLLYRFRATLSGTFWRVLPGGAVLSGSLCGLFRIPAESLQTPPSS